MLRVNSKVLRPADAMDRQRRTQAGFIQLIVLIIIAVIVVIGIFVIFLVIAGRSVRQAEIANQAVSGFDDPEGGAQIDSTLLGIRQLRCAVLPGISGVHTRALDARVARGYWKPAYEEMQQRNISITITYGFRNVCEQIQATSNSGGNLKCHWPSCVSPHLAGRAIDVDGIGDTKAGGKSVAAAVANPVLQILTKHGWRWLGRADWPHFDIEAYKVNDSSDYHQWVSEVQLFWKRQQERGGGILSECIGGRCDEFYSLMRRLPAFSGVENNLIVSGSRTGGWLVGTRGLVLHLRNGQWAPAKVSTTSCGTPDFNAVAVSSNGIMAVGAEGKVVRSLDNGEHWVCDKVSPVRETRAFFAVDLNNQWELVGGQGGAFYIRRDNTWSEIPGLDSTLSIQTIMIDGNTAFVAGGRQGYNDTPFILFSRDRGRNWELGQIGNNNLSGMVVGIVKLTKGYFAVTSDGQILQRKS